MNEFEKQLIENMAKKTAEFAKERADDITKPTSKSIGDNLGLMVDGVFGWLGAWGQIQKIKQSNYMEKYKQKIYSKIEKIPNEDLTEPNINIIGPAIESSKYFFEEEYYQEMFTNLIAASCNKNNKNKIHPSYVEVIKQLSPLDAKILNMFKYNSTYPIAEIGILDKNNKISLINTVLCDFKDQNGQFTQDELIVEINSSFDNLIRLNLIKKNREILELDYDYSRFESNKIYQDALKFLNDDSHIKMFKYRIELTNYGRNFFNVCNINNN